MNKIVVVDYGMGNLRSVAQALRHTAPEVNVRISNEVNDIKSADRIVLPGQGAMPDCMGKLKESGLLRAVADAAYHKPLLGICVGKQMLFDSSEEGDTECLGLIPGKVVKFRLEGCLQPDSSRYKVPQMGWNRVRQTAVHPLWDGITDQSHFYFVHSFYVQPENQSDCAGMCDYGQDFCCAVAHDNIFATQFHPEKSAGAGLRLFHNFVHWNP